MKFDFDDITMIPKMGIVDSRDEISTSVKFGKYTFQMPVIPANMTSVINFELAEQLARHNYFYVMHRFNVDTIKFLKDFKSKGLITSISLGVKDDAYLLIEKMLEFNLIPDYITIDIAHGHSIKMQHMLHYLKINMPDTFVIAGNVCTTQAIFDLEQWGADAIKVGIGPGHACFIDGTKVLTENGYKNIEDINIGEYVLTHDKTYQEVINTISYESDEILLNINGEICTEDHEFYICNINDIHKITDDNYIDFCYFEKAKNINNTLHKIIGIDAIV